MSHPSNPARSLSVVIAAFLFVLVGLTNANAQPRWEKLPGPYGGQTESIVNGPNSRMLFAAADGGVFRSSDAGRTWIPAGLADSGATQVLALPLPQNQEALFAIGTGSLYRSVDTGHTWQLSLNIPNAAAGHIANSNGILIIQVSSADTSKAGIYRSRDAGATWIRTGRVAYLSNLSDLFATGGNIFAATSDSGLYRSSDGGLDWAALPFVAGHTAEVIRADGSTLLAGTKGGIAVSTDNGSKWSLPPNAGLDTSLPSINAVAANGLRMVISAGGPPFFSSDGGRSWREILGADGIPSTGGVKDLEYADSQFFAGMWAGIYASPDGAHWTYSSTGEDVARIDDLAAYWGRIYTVQWQGISQSSDKGMTWQSPSGPQDLLDSLATQLVLGPDSTLYAAGNGFWKFESGAWHTLSDLPIAHVSHDSSEWYAALGSAGCTKSSDGGVSWIFINNGLPIDSASVYVVFPAANKLIALLSNGISFSSDDGASWQAAKGASGSGSDYAVTPFGIYVTDHGNLLRSLDGTTWQPDTSLQAQAIFLLQSFHGGLILGLWVSANEPPGLYFTRDGIHWNLISQPLMGIQDFAADDEYAYLGTVDGLWRTSLSNLPADLAVRQISNTETNIALTVFPNPATAKASAMLRLPASEEVSLSVYDARGTLVRQIASARYNQAENLVPLDLGGVAAGEYIVVARSETGLAAAKLVVK